MKKKAIVPKVKAELATPAKPQRGFEAGVDNEDLIIPRAKLVQAMAEEMTDKDLKKLYPALGVGSIINSLTKEPLGEEFIPIFMFKNYIRFNGRKKEDPGFDTNFEPGAIMWRSSDPLDLKVQKEASFGPNGETPLAITFMNFFSYFKGAPMPIIVSFAKTSYKTGKQLVSLAKFSGLDMFARKYNLTSAIESNDKGTFAIFKVQPAGKVEGDELKNAERLYNDYSHKVRDIKVHEEEKVEDGEGKRPY